MDDLLGTTFKKQIVNKLEHLLNKAHNIESLGEEINGVKAYHLKGTINKEDEIISEQEVWIDKEIWYVVKEIWKIVPDVIQNKTEIKVTELDNSLEIDETLFTQEIPEDAHMVDLDETRIEQQIIAMEEAIEKMGKHSLYVPRSLGYEVKIREYIQNSKTEGTQYMLIQEVAKDGTSRFNIFMNESETDIPEIGLYLGEEESHIKEIDIRGTKGYLIDKTMRRIIFQEDGIKYKLEIQDDNMQMEEAVEIIENMIHYE